MTNAQQVKRDKQAFYTLQDAKRESIRKLRRLWYSYRYHTNLKQSVGASICYGQCRGLLYALYAMYGREELESKLMLRLSYAERTPMHRY